MDGEVDRECKHQIQDRPSVNSSSGKKVTIAYFADFSAFIIPYAHRNTLLRLGVVEHVQFRNFQGRKYKLTTATLSLILKQELNA